VVQILSNLLGNAEKFTERGGRVVVSLRRKGPSVAALRVSDTGAGIPKVLLGRLFEPFTQAPQTKERNRGGLGLGLAMVKGLVELHGGSVRIESEGPGRGTEVTIELPLEHRRAAPAPSPAPRPVARPHRVLVVEDNPDSAETLQAVLTLGGHAVNVVPDGPSALELARTFRPEVVICDIGLPGMDGYDVARVFRSEDALRDIYLVALSGYAQPEDADHAMRAGFDCHLAKPIDPGELQQLLARLSGALPHQRDLGWSPH
jgi:CheY-like chemotaxis protein